MGDDDLDGSHAELDEWLLAGMPGPLGYAKYLVGPRAAQYRLIVDALLAAQTQSLTGVGRDDLLALMLQQATDQVGSTVADELLGSGGFELEDRMRRLREWGVVETWQDRAATEEDFLRNRDRYQLMPNAAELHRFILRVERVGGAASTTALLAASVLIARLQEFFEAVDRDDLPVADEQWAQVQTTTRDMSSAAASWQSHMAAALAGAFNADKAVMLRDTVWSYIEVWGASVDVHSSQIAEHSDRLSTLNRSTWRSLALTRVGSEAPEAVVDATIAEHDETCAALRGWFTGVDNQALRLRRQVRDAVPEMLRGHRTLLQVGGSVARRPDLLKVAAAIERSVSDQAGWETWCRATGLFAARHLALSSSAEAGGSKLSFWDAPPAHVEARLRTHGPRANVGAPARVPNMSAGRVAARQQAVKERAALLEAEAAIRERSGTTLASWGHLSRAEFNVAVELLACVSPRADGGGVRHGVSGNGRWKVTLAAADAGPSSAVLVTDDGLLVVENDVVEVTPA